MSKIAEMSDPTGFKILVLSLLAQEEYVWLSVLVKVMGITLIRHVNILLEGYLPVLVVTTLIEPQDIALLSVPIPPTPLSPQNTVKPAVQVPTMPTLSSENVSPPAHLISSNMPSISTLMFVSNTVRPLTTPKIPQLPLLLMPLVSLIVLPCWVYLPPEPVKLTVLYHISVMLSLIFV